MAAFSYAAVKQMQNRKPPAGPVVPKGDDVAMQAQQKLAEANPNPNPDPNPNPNPNPSPNPNPNPNPSPNPNRHAGAAEAGRGGRCQRGRVQVRKVSGLGRAFLCLSVCLSGGRHGPTARVELPLRG